MATAYKVLGQSVTSEQSVNVVAKEVDSNVVTLTTATPHKIVVGQYVTVAEDAQVINITNAETTNFVSTITTETNHRIFAGQTVTIVSEDPNYGQDYTGSFNVSSVTENTFSFTNSSEILDPAVLSGTNTVSYTDPAFNGRFIVESDPTATTFTYVTVSGDLAETAASNFTATSIPWEVVYECPSGASAIMSSIMICNQTEIPAKYSLAISDSLAMTNANVIFFNDNINSFETIQITGGLIADSTNKYLLVCSDLEYVSISAFGSEIS